MGHAITDWTAEQLLNAGTYGICLRCRTPREYKLQQLRDGTWSGGIICPNGCDELSDDELLDGAPFVGGAPS